MNKQLTGAELYSGIDLTAGRYDNLKGKIVHRGAEMTDTHVYFWGSIYSQWYNSNFTIDGIRFENAEKWMMYNKALHFGDERIAQMILAITCPSTIKKLGRQVKNFDPVEWDRVALDLVIKGNIAKFSQDASLRKMLLETGDRIIVEASPYDKIWGIGLGMANPDKYDESNWNGRNLLGIALMQTRDKLKEDLSW